MIGNSTVNLTILRYISISFGRRLVNDGEFVLLSICDYLQVLFIVLFTNNLKGV